MTTIDILSFSKQIMSVKESKNISFSAFTVYPRIVVMGRTRETYPNPRPLHATVASVSSKLLEQTGCQASNSKTSSRP